MIKDIVKNLKLSSKNDLIFFSKNKFQSEIRLLVNLFLKENISLFLNKLYNNWSPYSSVATWYLWRSLDPIPISY